MMVMPDSTVTRLQEAATNRLSSLPPAQLSLSLFFLNSGLSIAFLVFLNAAQPFVLSDLLLVPKEQLPRVAGTLVFCDELLGIAMVLVWGRLADSILSPRTVAAIGNLILSAALLLFVQARSVTRLLLARMLFATGSAAVTAMLSALLSILSSNNQSRRPAVPTVDPDAASVSHLPTSNERQPLLASLSSSPQRDSNPIEDRSSTRIAAFLGFSTGLGALLAVFLFLRFPDTLFRSLSPADALKWSFRLVALFALCNAGIAYYGLPKPTSTAGSQRQRGSIAKEIRSLGRGFGLVKKDRQIALGYLAGFVARAQNIAVAAFIPLYVAHYYRSHGLCGTTPGQHPVGNSPEDIKAGCRPAYSFASALTGSINLITLLTAPFLSLIRQSPPFVLLLTAALGAISFLLLGRGEFSLVGAGDTDPRSGATWLAAVGIGVAQIAAVVLSLSVVSAARNRLLSGSKAIVSHAREGDAAEEGERDEGGSTEEEVDREEIAGALAGAYSFCGGCGILFVSGLGSILPTSDRPGLPFLLVAGINLLLCISTGALFLRSRRATR